MSRIRLAVTVIIIIIVAAVLAYEYVGTGGGRDAGAVRVSGNIEVTEVNLSFRIPGWVERRAVSEGEWVEKGKPVARLDETELAQEVALRGAEVAAVAAALAELEAGSRPEEIAQAEAAVARAKAFLAELVAGSRKREIAAARAVALAAGIDKDRLKSDFERTDKLHQSGTITDQVFEAAKAAYEAAQQRLEEAEDRLQLLKEGPREEQIDQARAALKQAEAALELVRKGPRQETKDQARARRQQAGLALAIARTHLAYTALVSPVSGVVLSENVESGEYVFAGTPVVTVADLTRVYLRAYINDTDLGRVKLGQSVRVTADTWPGRVYEGRVSFIAQQAEFTPKNVQTQKERVKLVYRVKIDIANPKFELKPGMPADAEILVGGEPGAR